MLFAEVHPAIVMKTTRAGTAPLAPGGKVRGLTQSTAGLGGCLLPSQPRAALAIGEDRYSIPRNSHAVCPAPQRDGICTTGPWEVVWVGRGPVSGSTEGLPCPHALALSKGSVSPGRAGGHLQASQRAPSRAQPAGSLILGIGSPELWKVTAHCVGCPVVGLCHGNLSIPGQLFPCPHRRTHS